MLAGKIWSYLFTQVESWKGDKVGKDLFGAIPRAFFITPEIAGWAVKKL